MIQKFKNLNFASYFRFNNINFGANLNDSIQKLQLPAYHSIPNWKIFGIQRFSRRESLIITYLAIINVFRTFLDACARFSYFSWFSLHNRLYPIFERFFQSQKNHRNKRKTAKFLLPIGNFSRKIVWWRYFGLFHTVFGRKCHFLYSMRKLTKKSLFLVAKTIFFENFLTIM